jgi:hypothetical protein
MFRLKKEQTETTYRLLDEYNHEYTVIISEDHEGNLIWDILDSDGNSVENEVLVESIVHVIEAFRDEENLKGHEFNPN